MKNKINKLERALVMMMTRLTEDLHFWRSYAKELLIFQKINFKNSQ